MKGRIERERISSRLNIIARNSRNLNVTDVPVREDQTRADRQYQYYDKYVPENVIAHRRASLSGQEYKTA
jgi:hypothetical protein